MTASHFHRMCLRMNALTKKPDENPNNLLRSLLYSKPFESEETKYGKSMEPYAIQKFISEKKKIAQKFRCVRKWIGSYGRKSIYRCFARFKC